MQFGPNVVDEIVIPNDVPFLPGNNVIGIGTELPPELVAYGITAAMVFYFSNWNPNATVPTVKFGFIGVSTVGNQCGIVTGFGWCAAPHTSQVANVAACETVAMGNTIGTQLGTIVAFNNGLDDNIAGILEDPADTNRDGKIELFNNAFTHEASKTVKNTTPSTTWVVV